MNCPICGFDSPDGAAFCSQCGNVFNHPSMPPQNNPYSSMTPPHGDYNPNPIESYPNQKSKMAAGLLGILLGSLGIHNFYLGYTKRALVQLLATLLTCGIAGFAMEIWGLIEGIFYLIGHNGYTTDANGVPLKD